MLSVQGRTIFNTKGRIALSPWIQAECEYTVLQINMGSNSISLLEIVSALNSFNLARLMYEYHYPSRTKKNNPKVYLGAVQSVSTGWNQDLQNGQNWPQKSGSWPQDFKL